MTDRERKIHVLDLVCSLHGTREELLPEELADLRSLLEDLKWEGGWISVEERLPELGDEYLTVWDLKDGEPPVSAAFNWDTERKIFYDETYKNGVPDILYWQPLPQPPKP